MPTGTGSFVSGSVLLIVLLVGIITSSEWMSVENLPQATDVRWYPSLLRLLSANDMAESRCVIFRILGVDADRLIPAPVPPLDSLRRRAVSVIAGARGMVIRLGSLMFGSNGRGEDMSWGALVVGDCMMISEPVSIVFEFI